MVGAVGVPAMMACVYMCVCVCVGIVYVCVCALWRLRVNYGCVLYVWVCYGVREYARGRVATSGLSRKSHGFGFRV